ncbi:MLO-like protein 9 [Citrus sinensis]|uniref:MLO-like protein 9 n=1 Tax=Citrus sinensis TaxID=2711 RepID=A0ACB8KZ35_CITSI|nr:MLO-like protein 9 [Citrus sinensis]
MAGGGGGGSAGRELDQTPTWAVSMVCGIIVALSFVLEGIFHLVAKIFHKRHKYAMLEALEKIKGELMILGFISLLLTFGQNYIAQICIPVEVADTMLPCRKERLKKVKHDLFDSRGRALWYEQRLLAGEADDVGCHKGKVPLISVHGLHQLHIFIFFLAVFHVFYSAITMTLGRLKIRKWKQWERETESEQHMVNDSSRFRLTHETSFVRGHTNNWMKSPTIFYLICFFRQFFRSVRKADYLTMRHGFINVHLAPGSKFDFQKYIKRSLEDDFKVVVGISPPLWASMLVFLLLNINVSPPFDPFCPVSGKRTSPVRYCIYEFGLTSCFHDDFTHAIVRFFLGIAVQFMCSYITLPLYALVTQMGSTMKKAIFDDQTSKALKQWHRKARKHESIRSNSSYHRSLSHSLSQSIRTLGRPINSIRLQSLTSQRVAPTAAAAAAAAAAAEVETPPPNQTANITASVDLTGDQRQPNDKGPPNRQPPDLLS